ncbi:MAG: DUF502 domain-containing protein [Planctomycetes bacterium]|nr:DUF502 domain-containing protein [Planctomycetota bacterium]
MPGSRKHPIVRTFIRGLGLLLPLALTVGLLLWIWNQLSQKVIGHVSDGVTQVVTWMHLEPLTETTTFVVSVAVVLITILLIGLWFSGFVGRRIYRTFERALGRIPIVKAIYPHIKQITEFFFGENKQIEFKGVVAVEYPRAGLYSIGFLTGSSSKTLNNKTGEELVTVFIPSSPMPVTGYTIFVANKDIVSLDLTVDEALRTVISGGLLLPQKEQALGNSAKQKIETEE